MGFEAYLVESIKQMNVLLVKSEAHLNQRQDYLLEAAVVGCQTLTQLSGDPSFDSTVEEFADVRIIKRFLERASDDFKRRERQKADEFKTIIDDADEFEVFLKLEREVMKHGGLPMNIVDSLIESSREVVKEVRDRAKPPSEIIETVRLLRDRACLLSNDLINQAKNEDSWDGVKDKIKKIMLGLGGAALIGLNAGALAASFGITAVGSTVSTAIGSAVIGSAATDIFKARGATK